MQGQVGGPRLAKPQLKLQSIHLVRLRQNAICARRAYKHTLKPSCDDMLHQKAYYGILQTTGVMADAAEDNQQ
jgi:hypothetical protein